MDLCSLFSINGLLADHNGDGWSDAVQARVLLRSQATLHEQLAAVNIAARLGFETMSLALPIAAINDELASWSPEIHPIVVCLDGNGATRVGTSSDDGAIAPLSRGQGVLRLDPATARLPEGIAVIGADAEGLSAAAALLYGRLPYLWNVGAGQPTFGDLRAALESWLTGHAIGGCAVSVVAAYVTASWPGIERLEIEVRGVAPGDVDRLARLIEAEDRQAAAFSYPGVGRMVITLRAGDAARRVVRENAVAWRASESRDHVEHRRDAAPTTPCAPLSLASLYAVDGGLFADTRGDMQPNRLRARLVLSRSACAAEAVAACALAARLGLETLGLELPLAIHEDDRGTAQPGEVHIVVGASSDQFASLQNGAIVGAALLREAGAGRGSVVAAEDDARVPVVLVAGAEPGGTEAALHYLAERTPYLADAERGKPTLADVEAGLQETLAANDPAGEAAAVLAALDEVGAALNGHTVRSLDVEALVARPSNTLAECLHERLAALTGAAAVSVRVDERTTPLVAFDESWQAPWEVERVWDLCNDRVLPALHNRPTPRTVELDVRVSEPPEARRSLRAALIDALVREGVPRECCHVVVGATYKQGSAWLREDVLPRLQARGDVHHLLIRCRSSVPPSGAGWLELPTRWVQELFPVDELLAQALGIELSEVRYELSDTLTTTYEVEAWNDSGEPIFRAGFTAHTDERPYLVGYPHWGLVHPDTGWLTARVDGEALVDERIPTDRERFWDFYQGTILPRLATRIRSLTAGRSVAEVSPFFERLEIDLAISEEDSEVGLREERYSPLESLHEDLYFVTLDYCSAVTLTAQAEATGEQPYLPPWMWHGDERQALPRSSPFSAPGLIVPYIHQSSGVGPEARVRLTELRAARPTLRWRAVLADGSTQEQTTTIAAPACPRPRTTAVVVAPGGAVVEQAEVVLTCTDAAQRSLFARRLDALAALHDHHLFTEAPPRSGLARLAVIVAHDAVRTRREFGPAPIHSDHGQQEMEAALTPAAPSDMSWDALIGYEENNRLLRRLNLYPEVQVWQAGTSLQGRASYVAEVTAPLPGPLRSQAKASTYKPTLLINTRHHANETSGTSAVLRLIALCATDPDVRAYLQRVNLVVIPFENVDGAVLHEELQREHPTWMLHAGRYNARGMEFRLEYTNASTRYPEARVLPLLHRLWLPDIVTDDHGFPSHEWVQPFGGYANAWFASDWIPRGLIYLYLPFLQGPGWEGHEQIAMALRQSVVDELNRDDEIRAWNRIWADRFKAYAHQWLPERFPASYDQDVLVLAEGITPDPARPWTSWMTGFADVYPAVTAVSWITEVADETARGAYHHLCARAHLLADLATLRLLATADPGVQRNAEESNGRIVLSVHRPRPPRPRAYAAARGRDAPVHSHHALPEQDQADTIRSSSAVDTRY